MRLAGFAATVLASLLSQPAVAVAATFPSRELVKTPPDRCALSAGQQICSDAGGGGFDVTGNEAGQGASNGNGTHGSSLVSLPDTYVLSDYIPTCNGNNALNGMIMCAAAVLTCQPKNTGLVRYWRYDTTYLRATNQPQGSPVFVPGTVCVRSNAPRVSPVAAIAAVVANEFQDLVVLKGNVVVSPRGTTLVNYENAYYTNAKRYVLDPVQILGHAVVVTAIPKSYDWHFGDGTSALDAGPGAKGTKDVHHNYKDTGKVAPHVVITWTGTFTVDGGAPIAVFGTAQTTGPGTPLQVKQARAELVTG